MVFLSYLNENFTLQYVKLKMPLENEGILTKDRNLALQQLATAGTPQIIDARDP